MFVTWASLKHRHVHSGVTISGLGCFVAKERHGRGRKGTSQCWAGDEDSVVPGRMGLLQMQTEAWLFLLCRWTSETWMREYT